MKGKPKIHVLQPIWTRQYRQTQAHVLKFFLFGVTSLNFMLCNAKKKIPVLVTELFSKGRVLAKGNICCTCSAKVCTMSILVVTQNHFPNKSVIS